MSDSVANAVNDQVLPEDAFELAWTAHFTENALVPEIEPFLPKPAAPDYRDTLVRLIAIDLERRLCAPFHYRQCNPERDTDGVAQASLATTKFLPAPPLRDYLQRFNIAKDAPEIPDLVAAEYEARRRAGHRVNFDEYYQEYPDWKAKLQTCLPAREEELRHENLAAVEYETPRIEGFTIVRELGRGGMSVVYLAKEESIGRLVAIKIAKHVPRSEQELARYEREPQRMAKLPGHGVVEIYQTGNYQGRPYLICKYLSRGSLSQYWREKHSNGLLPTRQAVTILRDVARTMDEVHRRGVVHRDLKPANILLDEFEDPHVMDFGLSWDKAEELDQDPMPLIEGTPPYMPPEQALGVRPAAYEPAVDIYSLGATLYWAVAGKPPFLAETIQKTLELVATQEPASPRQDNPTLSRDLETICLKCLEKKPERRYATAGELADDLDRFLRNEPVQARPVGAVARGWKWGQREPWFAGASALALGLLLLALGVSLSYGQYMVVARQRSDRRFYTAQSGRAHSLIDQGRVAPTLRLLDTINPNRMPDAPRGFEWDYALRMCHHHRYEVRDHAAAITALAVAAKAGLVASGDAAGDILLTDGATGKQLAKIETGIPIDVLALSPDGQHLAAAMADTQVRIWRVRPAGCEFLRAYEGHVLRIRDLVFHPSLAWVASASDEGNVRVFDFTTGKDQHVLEEKAPRQVTRILFQPPGKELLILAGSEGGNRNSVLWNWKLASGKLTEVMSFENWGGGIRDVAHSPNRQRLFVLTDDQRLTCIEEFEGQPERAWSMPARAEGDARDRGLVTGGDWVAVTHSSGEAIEVHDAATGRLLRTLRGMTDRVSRVAASDSGDVLAVAAGDWLVKIWDGNQDPDQHTLTGHLAPPKALAVSPDGRWLASGGNDHGVFCWDLDQLKLHKRYGSHTITVPPPRSGVPQFPSNIASKSGHFHFVMGVAFSPDSQQIVSVSWDKKIIVWDIAGKKEVRRFDTNVEFATGLAMHPAGKEVAVCGFNGPVFRYDWQTGRLLGKWGAVNGRVTFAAYDPRGKHLASGDTQGQVQVRDVASGELVYELPGFVGNVTRVAYSPDGKWLAAGGADRSIRVWKLPPKNPPLLLEGHSGEISGLSFMPDGRLASTSPTSSGGSLKLWDLETEQELMSLPGGYSHVVATPDGTRLIASLSKWHAIRVLDSRPVDADPRRLATSIPPPLKEINASPTEALNIKLLGSFETESVMEDLAQGNVLLKAPAGKRFLGVAVSTPVHLEMTTAAEFKEFYDRINDNPEFPIDQAHAGLITSKHYRLVAGDREIVASYYGPWPLAPNDGVNSRFAVRRHLQDQSPFDRELRLVVFEIPADLPLESLQVQMRDRKPVPLPARKLPAPQLPEPKKAANDESNP